MARHVQPDSFVSTQFNCCTLWLQTCAAWYSDWEKRFHFETILNPEIWLSCMWFSMYFPLLSEGKHLRNYFRFVRVHLAPSILICHLLYFWYSSSAVLYCQTNLRGASNIYHMLFATLYLEYCLIQYNFILKDI